MKKQLLFSLWIFVAGALPAADSGPKAVVINAATALGSQTNYSWKTTVEFALANSSMTQHGRTELGGYTIISRSSGNDRSVGKPTEIVIKGAKVAIKLPDKGWRSATEILQDNSGGFSPGKALARTVQDFKPPAVMAASLAAHSQNWEAGTNGIAGELIPEDAEAVLGSLPAATNRHVSVTFWIADGKLAKYQWHATGTVKFNGANREMDRKATTEITDVNATTLDVPDEAKQKLE